MAGLKTQLKADLVTAMKAHDEAAKSTLRMALAAIAVEEVSGSVARALTEAEELAVVTREVSKRRDSAEAYTAGHRPELAAKELAEAAILQAYLPARLTEGELDDLVAQEVAEAEAALGARPTMKQMGLVIKAVNARAQGRAEGASIAAKVRAALG